MQSYTSEFYEENEEGSRRSAKAVVPLILQLIQPKRVVDVGCGLGIWLSVFKEYGVEEVLGIDGDYVDRKLLQIPEANFLPRDLKEPLILKGQFDLVVSLEVAEHLPIKCAGTFVDSLVRLGPIVLFSAAPPFQGGTHHVNEQWPDYWRTHFQERGFEAIDCIRKKVWQNDEVEWWYAQNTLLFAKPECIEKYPLLKKEYQFTNVSQLSVVHPTNFLNKNHLIETYRADLDPNNMSLKQVLLLLPLLTRNAFMNRFKRSRP